MSYSEFVRSRFKPGEKIAAEITPHKAEALNTQCEIFVWFCERLDSVKKYAVYNQNLERALFLLQQPFSVDRFKDFTLTPQQAELLHAAIGIAGEAGELLDTVRKHVFDGQPLDRDNVIEELGDLEFYMMAAMMNIGVLRPHLQELNMAKLSRRYESGYSDQQAHDRKDKQ